jgi:adenylate cyclase
MSQMSGERVERRLAAIMAGDIAGYSRLMGADEEGTLRDLKELRASFLHPKITEHRGRIVKTTGDGVLIEFPSVVDAVRCAVEIQRGMAERAALAPVDRRIDLRYAAFVPSVRHQLSRIASRIAGAGLSSRRRPLNFLS